MLLRMIIIPIMHPQRGTRIVCNQRQPNNSTPRRGPKAPARLKLWQLDPRLHCSVIGTCLSLDDLRRICTRVGLQINAPVSDYELHHAFVAMADRPLPAIRQLHKTLERKYRDEIARCADAPELAQYWQNATAQGNIPGAYWALLTRPDLPASLQERAMGEVHMLSHLSGASRQAEPKRLNTLERRLASVQAKLERSQQEQQRRQNQHAEKVQRLQLRLREAMRAERRLADAQQRLNALENNDLVRRLRNQVEAYAAQLADTRLARERAEAARDAARERAEHEHRAHCAMRAQLHQICRERDALDAYVQAHLNGQCAASCGTDDPSCDVDLCGRCILYVGGRQNVNPHLVKLVQRCNGRLLCHDGGQEDSRARLASLLPQADAVVCPIDCVSHDAYRRVKQYCKQYAKRLVLLPTASLSAFARGLQDLTPATP